MGMEDIEKKMKELYKDVKSGKLTEEIAEEISELIDKVEEIGGDFKESFSSMINDMKESIKKMK
ncbi:MAG: hypothetical protein HUJ77_04195 [Clostridium sp.]|uniref:hypothetical protein n=1 Tax=Clostridium sp. TaxID=1506 RepID=UPI0025C47417|nr:hypothetical protein [Clostridium sp.]MCF0147580.1 hypothetical protein [Clostridium sp.]